MPVLFYCLPACCCKVILKSFTQSPSSNHLRLGLLFVVSPPTVGERVKKEGSAVDKAGSESEV
jgi:hypothetical protein